jgi:hypothetical protein
LRDRVIEAVERGKMSRRVCFSTGAGPLLEQSAIH